MKAKIILLALALSASTSLLSAQDTPPSGDAQRPPGAEAGPGPRGQRGGFHVLPPGAAEKLNLTDDQKKQIADLEADVKVKMDKILTPDQLAQLKKLRPHPQRGGGGGGPEGGQGGGQGGPGGGPDGGQGGPGGPGGNQPPN